VVELVTIGCTQAAVPVDTIEAFAGSSIKSRASGSVKKFPLTLIGRINIPYTFPSARLRHNISSLSTMSNRKPSCTYVKPPQALEVPVPTCTITPHGDATSTSSTCPHLPAKLWTDIFLYMDLAYLWPSCRSVSRVFQANIDFVLRSQPIPRLTGIIFKTDFKTLSHFSSDKSIAWFKSGAVPSEPLEWKRCRKLN
jgi:hypothetical protein